VEERRKTQLSVSVEGADVVVRRAGVAELVDLRHAVLRQGLPRGEAVFPGDHDPASRHYGAFRGADALCCATLHASEWAGEPAYQLRGMATAPEARRMGLGKRVMEFMEQDLRAAGGTLLMWCNARVPAVEFYRSMGWEVVSDPFEIPTAGPHVRMVKWLRAGEGMK
jgi:GNAT superfamily N-acetyltransferase